MHLGICVLQDTRCNYETLIHLHRIQKNKPEDSRWYKEDKRIQQGSLYKMYSLLWHGSLYHMAQEQNSLQDNYALLDTKHSDATQLHYCMSHLDTLQVFPFQHLDI